MFTTVKPHLDCFSILISNPYKLYFLRLYFFFLLNNKQQKVTTASTETIASVRFAVSVVECNFILSTYVLSGKASALFSDFPFSCNAICNTCAICIPSLSVICSICSRQLYPSLMTSVFLSAPLTAGNNTLSPALTDTSYLSPFRYPK